VKAGLAQAPPEAQAQLISGFGDFTETLKVAFSSSIGTLFIASTVIMLLAFGAVLFLPEIKLRRTNRPILEEAGAELETELANIDPDHEPDLTGEENGDEAGTRRGPVEPLPEQS